jgi:hypothetical protein
MDGSGKDGKTPYQFSGVDWHVDPFFNANTVIGLDTSHFFLGVGDNEVPRPISEIFDNVPFFKTTSSATFDVNFYYQMELLSDNPAAGVADPGRSRIVSPLEGSPPGSPPSLHVGG